MPLANRIIKVTLTMPNGAVVVLDQTLHMRVQIFKASLAIQNRATIEITNLTKSLREQLLSMFTAWNRQQLQTYGPAVVKPNWVYVQIDAGYQVKNASGTATAQDEITASVFKGQVVIVEPTSGPPNIGVKITCYTRQIDKTSDQTERVPPNLTVKEFVTWAAGQMGFGKNFVCETSYNDTQSNNPAGAIYKQSQLLPTMQNLYMPNIAAYVDDDFLIVKDRNKILNPSNIQNISQFIGVPSWTQWGAQFTTLLDPTIRLAQGVNLTSVMNPKINGQYVVMEIEYSLTSREEAFYGKIGVGPPA